MVSSSRLREDLTAAQAAWEVGNWRATRQSAKQVLANALVIQNPQIEAHASALLAQALSLESHFRLAAQFALRARKLFWAESDPSATVESLLVLSYAESALGNQVESVLAAEQAVAGLEGAQRSTAAGLTYRGVAALWESDFGTARGVLEAASRFVAEESPRRASAFQPLANTIFSEVLRCADLRMKGVHADLAGLEDLLGEAWSLVKAGSTDTLVNVPALPGMFLLSFASCFLASRGGNLGRADKYYLKCLEFSTKLPQSSWMGALVWWARLERTIAAREVQEAAVSAQRMLATAEAGEHVPMKALARRLASEAQNHIGSAPSPYATYM